MHPVTRNSRSSAIAVTAQLAAGFSMEVQKKRKRRGRKDSLDKKMRDF